ncbi:hypothetical protein ABFU82_04910 [Nocardioides sp. WV_118_6]|uniref:hypothetical protein n=1 Tax=Pimelobacter TaxID=2044 RepID=UPI001C03D010|nr:MULTISPECIES: hypothetical protein [Pimelobacter]MBU2696518.1 hypothetical protein [Pimelobacter sp. 30-1]UUW87688.1 hypothetical protein M0M43_18305 [Pimelobacter simplex]UUW97194.1 hypothetical protein M0M48_06955 [Pimelobacter simplex]
MNLAYNLLSLLLLAMIVLALLTWVRRDDLSTGRDLHGDRRPAHRERKPDVRTLVARDTSDASDASDASERTATTRTRRGDTARRGSRSRVRHAPAMTAPVTSRPATK